MGALKGDAYAGSEGKEDAIIASSVLRPSHLRIADLVMSGSDLVHTDDQAKCAYVDGTSRSLVVDRIQSLYQIRKSLKTS
jgi:septum site-determining protein MinC